MPIASLRPVVYASLMFALLFGVLMLALRYLLPHLWRSPAVRLALAAMLLATAVALGLWSVGGATRTRALFDPGVYLAWAMLAIALPLAVATVTAGVLWRTLDRLLLRRAVARDASSEPDTSRITRRAVIQWSTAALPMAALGASATGLVAARGAHVMPTIPMRFAALPPDLDGLRILHLTDLHLGQYLHLRDLERVVERLADARPDLIVFTGDVADDLTQLVPALRLAASLRPRLGVFGAVGNHEYFRGLAEVRRLFDKSPVPLLLESGVTLAVGDAKLHVSGVADPVRMGGDLLPFMRQTVDAALDGAPSDAFHLLLSHRPDGFLAAAARGVDLTLSGHTHGVQVGLFGRSVFEPFWPDKFLRGAYERGASRLYTSAGFGHWLPFRLNCPAEAPTIVLARA